MAAHDRNVFGVLHHEVVENHPLPLLLIGLHEPLGILDQVALASQLCIGRLPEGDGKDSIQLPQASNLALVGSGSANC